MIKLNKLLFGRLMIEEGFEYDGEPNNNTPILDNNVPILNQIDQSQISGNGIYEWRAVSGLYGISKGRKAFCIYNGKLYKANSDIDDTIAPDLNSGWVEVGSSSVDTLNFTDLQDTPNDYIGNEDKVLKVKQDGSGIEFVEQSTVGSKKFIELDDTPNDISTDGKFIKTQGNSLVLVDEPSYNFTELNDTPNRYIGNANKIVSVNSTENGLEFIDAPNPTVDLSSRKFTELSDTPSDISTDGKILITNGNKLILSDLPDDCGIIANYPTNIVVKNGNDLTINDIQQFINQAIDKIPIERTYGYVSVKCIDPTVELFPVNKGLIEYIDYYGNTLYTSRINGLKLEYELIHTYGVLDKNFNTILSFKDTNNNNITCVAATQNDYKRIMDTNRKIYDLNTDGKYEYTNATVNSSLYTYELSMCGKYIVGCKNSNSIMICEFTDSSANTTVDTEIIIDNIEAGGYSNVYRNRNVVDDLVFGKYYDDTKRFKAYRIKLDLINKTLISSDELFDIEIPEELYYDKNKTAMSFDMSIFAICGKDNKLKLIVKDSDNSYRFVRTDLNIDVRYGMSISNDNYLTISGYYTKRYRINLAPSLLCVNQRNETIVTTYDKTADKVSIITDTKYALLKADGIYIWDIIANTETKIVDNNTITDIKSCATHIIYSYGTNSDAWAVIDLNGNQIKNGNCSSGIGNIDIAQTSNGYNYAIREYIGGNNDFRYTIKDQDDNVVLSQDYNYKLHIAIKNMNNIVGTRSESGSNGTTIYVVVFDSNGLTNGSIYYSGSQYETFDLHSINGNIILNVNDENNNYSNIILCIEDINNIAKCGIFANRKGCSNLYDTSLNNIVSIDTNNSNKIVVLDYDR